MIKPRDYQQESHDNAIAWVRSTPESCLIELPTGAGKSVVVAMIANTLHQISNGKHVLCLVPSKELAEQNAAKIELTGNKVSMFSASIGKTCLENALVVGTPVSVKNQIHRFGSRFCAVVIDECHKITPTIKSIIDSIREHNPNLRVIGLSATPYRMGQGYIYAVDESGKGVEETKDPYFTKLVYRLDAKVLIERGYLTQPVIGSIHTWHYETIGLDQKKDGSFNAADIDKAFVGRGRLTSDIVADVVAQSVERKGVMFFAATVQHANEIMESLPPAISAIVTGATDKYERELILHRFKSKAIKYIVNVSVLTTGFDAPHADVIAIMRATESVALLQQIIGRGLRIDDGKVDCLILDYAENVERHCPDGDVFNPQIKAAGIGDKGEPLHATCPSCNGTNEFSKRKDIDDTLPIDDNGYCLDLEGNRVYIEGIGEMPAHYGRRCTMFTIVKGGAYERCSYRWTFKPCPECEHENDIAARYCGKCKTELVDPNDKLKLEHSQIKDASVMQTEECLDVQVTPTISKAGNECLKVKFTTPTRSFLVWFNKATTKQITLHAEFDLALSIGIKTITYKKEVDFFKIHGYNKDVLV